MQQKANEYFPILSLNGCNQLHSMERDYRAKTETENTNDKKGNNIQTGVKFVKNWSCTLL